MDDRNSHKRRLPEDDAAPVQTGSSPVNGIAAPYTPPPNKRLNSHSASGNSSPRTPAREDGEPMTAAEEILLNFQKEAIWRQMQEYLREIGRSNERINKAEKTQVQHDAIISITDSYWSKMKSSTTQQLQDLLSMVAQSKIQLRSTDLNAMGLKEFSSAILESAIDGGHQEVRELTAGAINFAAGTSSKQVKDVTLKLLRLIESWSQDRTNLWTELAGTGLSVEGSATVQILAQEHTSVTQNNDKLQIDVDRLEANCHKFADQVSRLKNMLEMTKNRLMESTLELDASKSRIRRTEQRLHAQNGESLNGVVADGQVGSPGVATPSTSELLDLSEASREELLQYRRLAISRLSEVEEMEAQRTALHEELEKFKAQLSRLPDEKLQDSEHVRSLLVQMQNLRYEADYQRSVSTTLKSELDDLHASRRKFVDTLENEEKNRRATLEAELKKLESDISRVRDSRDRFQQMYENRCTKDDYEMQQNQEIRKIANTRKDRITALSADIQRLQTMLATEADDSDPYAFCFKGPNDKSVLTDLQSKWTTSESRLRELSLELDAYKEALSQVRSLEEVTASESALRGQTQDLSAKIATLEDVVGPSASDEIKGLVATVESNDKTIRRLEHRVQAREAVQAPLLNELHTVATAWGQLEEATSRKAIDLAQKEDLIFKLLSDKTRQEAKCSNLVRAKEQSTNMTAVMKRQSDLQLEQIKRLEERENASNALVAAGEKEQTKLSSEVILQKTRLQEFTQQNANLKEKFSKQEEMLSELQVVLKERTDAFETEASARRRLLEEAEPLKRKLEEQAKKPEGSNDSEAVKQAARYLQLLKCPACDVNFKSHVILRCMHVFCKSCTDKLVEIRQRKCPTCRESFGANDVKEIYL